jgi:hypothetical protein
LARLPVERFTSPERYFIVLPPAAARVDRAVALVIAGAFTGSGAHVLVRLARARFVTLPLPVLPLLGPIVFS